ncbi:hypothetical protein L3X38_017963 [Prunus dulcis]|uniref:HTH myb-type domain-containing protein n=1 Tax=Prunus dulcis TaxID=3755 RepID=A0AAD4ZAJ2_PRUDU|nr:hypothetical protein L3X38_017963 [Prunus dulcis]
MLILSPLRDGHHQLKEEKQLGGGGRDEGEVEGFDFNGGNSVGSAGLDFPEFSGGMGNLLDSIDFDDLFIGIHDGDVLPDLEMDSEILDFSAHRDHGDEYYHNNAKTTSSKVEDQEEEEEEEEGKDRVRAAADSLTSATTTRNNQTYSSSSNTSTTTTSATQDQDRDGGHEEIGSKGDCNSNINNNMSQIRASHQREQNQLLNQSSSPKESADQKLARKSSSTAQSKNSHGKRKVKVDWTPELHRRFVQAVEQLGVDKAVPSRILELMGIDCLTRHNIASHLQKYRSHRKHLLAREAEAASWTQRRQMYGAATVSGGGRGGGGGGVKSSRSDVMMMNSPNWLNAPTMGFPPIPSPTPPSMHHHHHHQMIRPLHVWGHPSMDQSMVHMWPKHLPHNFPSRIPPPPPAHAWPPPPPPPSDASYWHHPPPHHQRVPNALTPGTPCFPRQLATATQQRFPAPPVPGIPPHAMYKVDTGIAVPSPQSGPHPLVDFHPSNESIDAAIGDVLSKPWLPLPLGLRPPATDSVMVELQRQGIPKIPPSCA